MTEVLIIAEAGVNHNGDESTAYGLVDHAVSSGADAIKFQTFKAERMVTEFASKASYQMKNDRHDKQLAMLKELELSTSAFKRISKYCKKKNIIFMTTAFDSESLEFVLKDLSVETLKIPSGEINNAPFLLEHARSGRDIIMSTGMSNENEIIDALGVIAFGFLNNSNPSKEAFLESYESEKGKDHLKNKLSLLHCTSEYPTPLRNVNLRAMQRIMEKFDLRTGYSDHSEEIITAIVAVTIGATIIEKHLTINKSFEGPDHNTSFDPVEFKKMVQAIRNVELVLGSEHKTPTQMEKKNKLVSRKSIVAKIKIKKGDIFSIENITAKRPGDGIDPMFFWELIGTSSQNSYNPDDQIHE